MSASQTRPARYVGEILGEGIALSVPANVVACRASAVDVGESMLIKEGEKAIVFSSGFLADAGNGEIFAQDAEGPLSGTLIQAGAGGLTIKGPVLIATPEVFAGYPACNFDFHTAKAKAATEPRTPHWRFWARREALKPLSDLLVPFTNARLPLPNSLTENAPRKISVDWA